MNKRVLSIFRHDFIAPSPYNKFNYYQINSNWQTVMRVFCRPIAIKRAEHATTQKLLLERTKSRATSNFVQQDTGPNRKKSYPRAQFRYTSN